MFTIHKALEFRDPASPSDEFDPFIGSRVSDPENGFQYMVLQNAYIQCLDHVERSPVRILDAQVVPLSPKIHGYVAMLRRSRLFGQLDIKTSSKPREEFIFR